MGLNNVKIPIAAVREIGNSLVVDQVPGEADFTWAMESLGVDTGMEALFQGKTATGSGWAQGAGQADAVGTPYPWANAQGIHICSPWKDPTSYSSGNVIAGHLVPNLFPSKLGYKMGVTEDCAMTAELRSGEFFYGNFAPTEDITTGDGSTLAFVTAEPAVEYRRGGHGGTIFQNVLGVLINGVQQTEGADYTVTGGGAAGSNIAATVTFVIAPATGAKIRLAYFTTNAHSYPDTIHESALVLPGAVRGRNVKVSLAVGASSPASWSQVHGMQTITLDASLDITPERELDNDELISFTVNGTNTTGAITLHAKDAPTFMTLLGKFTGLDVTQEIIGFLNVNPLQLKIEIFDPHNPGTVLKTLWVGDAFFSIPGTTVKVNTVVDFTVEYQSITGTYTAYKGATAAI
jgi:hypothetical protein